MERERFAKGATRGRAGRRRLRRNLLALPLLLLAGVLLPGVALAAGPSPAGAAPGEWPQFRHDVSQSGTNPDETTLTPARVAAGLTTAWTATTGGRLGSSSSPAVAGGVAYVGSEDGKLYAFDAAGSTGCSGSPKTCSPLWTATTVSSVDSSPAVAGGVVYVGSHDHKLYAFDAAGSTGCSGSPKTCTPLWTATTGDWVTSSPTVTGGVVYVGSWDHNLYAFDAAGSTGCSGSPKTCSPLWTAPTGDSVFSSPAVAGGVVYVGSYDGKFYAFDAAGSTGCSGSPKTCSPLWTAPTLNTVISSPAVAGGVVYVGSSDGKLYAFDAAGSTGCSGSPKTCSPLWTAPTADSVRSSPAVAGGVVYVGSRDGALYAFDATGSTGCSGSPKTCSPLWTATTGNSVNSSPAVAGGVVYVGSSDGKLYAFDATGSTGCSGSPKRCTPLWTTATGGAVRSSPAVAGGVVYVGSDDNKLYAFSPGPAAISTQASAGGPVGSAVTDTATVAGGANPGGTVAFSLYSDAGCTNQVGATSTTSLTGGTATSDPITPASPGTYYWIAVYSGDANNAGATSPCQAANESVTIDYSAPTISTAAASLRPEGGVPFEGPAGSAVTDTATLAGGANPGGTVDFSLYSDAGCTTQVGATSTKPLTGGTATADPITPTSPGTYYWTAVYSGDANNWGATSPCQAANESVTIIKATPTTSAAASAGGPVGTAVTDTARLVGGYQPTGNVRFTLYSDAGCTTQVGAASIKSLSGGSATSDPITPASPGTYYWTVDYSGDANNVGLPLLCQAANESVTITVEAATDQGSAAGAGTAPTISTAASPGGPVGSAVTDTATVAGGANPGGTVAFKLFRDAGCTTQVGATSTKLLAGGSATSDPITPTSPGTYYWTAVYSGDANNGRATSPCQAANESVTITDTDLGIGPVPAISKPATSAAGAPVSFTLPVASDEGGESPAVNCDHASGSTFPVGVTTVTCSASDSDDVPSSVMTSFTVTVTRAPTVTVVASSADPSVFAQSVTFTATVSGSDGGGAVAFYADGSSSPTDACAAVALSPAGGGYQATCTTSTLAVGVHSIGAAYSGDTGFAPSNGVLAGGQTVNKAPTVTVVASSADPSVFAQSVTFTATVSGSDGGGALAFYADGSSSPIDACAAVALSPAGGGYQATCTTSTLAVGVHSIGAAYSGDTGFAPSNGVLAGGETVNKAPTVITSTATLQLFLAGGAANLSSTLTSTSSAPVAAATVTMTIGSGTTAQSCTTTTNGGGTATCAIPVLTQPLGYQPVTDAFAGDSSYLSAGNTQQALVYANAPAGGSFVVGDHSATGSVTFWGSQWAKTNSLSGGGAPASFKGFENSTAEACGVNWTAGPDNSGSPPAGPLPSYLAVTVASHITKSGPTISGDTASVVIVHTDPGYGNDPGHAGTGIVVATLCTNT